MAADTHRYTGAAYATACAVPLQHDAMHQQRQVPARHRHHTDISTHCTSHHSRNTRTLHTLKRYPCRPRQGKPSRQRHQCVPQDTGAAVKTCAEQPHARARSETRTCPQVAPSTGFTSRSISTQRMPRSPLPRCACVSEDSIPRMRRWGQAGRGCGSVTARSTGWATMPASCWEGGNQSRPASFTYHSQHQII